MIHCYFGDYSSHKNEVTMLNRFLSQLQLDWNDPEDWIYVIFNAMWNGEEIDVVCFTPHAIIVADLKNYTGKLSGGENGSWEINTGSEIIEVKGGGQINPYVQIRKNKFSLINYLKNNNLFSNSQVDHVSAILIFSELESCEIDVPSKVQRWLHISDIPHSSADLNRLHNPQIQINEEEIQALIKNMKLQSYQWQAGQISDIRFNPFENPFTTNALNSGTSQHHSVYNHTSQFSAAQLYTQKPPSLLKSVLLPFFLTIIIAFVAGFYHLYDDLDDTSKLSNIGNFIGLSDHSQNQASDASEHVMLDLLPFYLGMSLDEILENFPKSESVTSSLFSGKILALYPKNSEIKTTYLFFSNENKIIGIRHVMDQTRERGIDHRYDQFKSLKQHYKQKGYSYHSGDEPFVGTQVATYRDKATETYYQVFQPHLSFTISTFTMTKEFFNEYAKKAVKNNRGSI